MAVLLPPSTLTAKGSSLEQIQCFYFNLTPQQAGEIERNRLFKDRSVEYTVKAQLRFCLMETTSEQNDNFPHNLQVRVNSRICPLPQFLPCRPNAIPKRPSKPLCITPFCKISSLTSNGT